MAELYMMQGFERINSSNTPAPLTRTEFQPFTLYTISISHAMMIPSALLNLENLIFISFWAAGVEISLTPY